MAERPRAEECAADKWAQVKSVVGLPVAGKFAHTFEGSLQGNESQVVFLAASMQVSAFLGRGSPVAIPSFGLFGWLSPGHKLAGVSLSLVWGCYRRVTP